MIETSIFQTSRGKYENKGNSITPKEVRKGVKKDPRKSVVRKQKIKWKKLKCMCNYRKSKVMKIIPAVTANIYFIWKLGGWLDLTVI